MKLQKIKKLFTLLTTIMVSVSIFVFYNSCKKERNPYIFKASNPLTANTAASSTIVYMDVKPDSVINLPFFPPGITSAYRLDLNNDGAYDFILNLFQRGQVQCRQCYGGPVPVTYAEVSPANNNAIRSDRNYFPLALVGLVIIDGLAQWSSVSAQILLRGGFCSCSISVGQGNYPFSNIYPSVSYLGVKLISGSYTYYGWVRLSLLGNPLWFKF